MTNKQYEKDLKPGLDIAISFPTNLLAYCEALF
jgi:hypothetical protein